MRLKFARRRPITNFPGVLLKISTEVDVSLPLKGGPLTLNREITLADIGDAIGAKFRMMFNEHAALSYELDPAHTESEKNVALLIACAELTSIAKWRFPLVMRLTRLVHALDGVSKGISDPMLTPKYRVGGRAAPSMERFRLYCVLAVEAKCTLDGIGRTEDTKSFLMALEQSEEPQITLAQWASLFETRSDSLVSNEEKRRCNLIKEWSKPRAIERLSPLVLREHGIWSKYTRREHSKESRGIYMFFLSLALLQAKSLVEARG